MERSLTEKVLRHLHELLQLMTIRGSVVTLLVPTLNNV